MEEAVVGDDYDVFLSFRGDIRKGFVSVVYDYLVRAQIHVRVFRDSDEISVGSRIDQTLLEALDNSKVFIPIFSKNYTSSKWCLREVTKMVELVPSDVPENVAANPKRKIMPIYYDVEPSDVKDPAGTYIKSMRELYKGRDSKEVICWENALNTVGKLNGMELRHSSNLARFCKSLTSTVLDVLKKIKGFEEVSPDDYDVFLSFRGPDVRHGFISVLYDYLVRAGFIVCRDDDLYKGHISESIFKAIRNSKICVPVFTKNYVSSIWCLEEVEHIVSLNKTIMPIFYDVKPDDVKLKTPIYKDAIIEHTKQYISSYQLKRWENALKAVAAIKGIEMKDDEISLADFCRSCTRGILSLMKPTKRYDAEGLVGMSEAVDKVMGLLNADSLDVGYICITGMGGIGKSTLAKFIFDQLLINFDNSAFIEDTRETSGRHGLHYLEKQLREKLDPSFIINSNLSRNIKERFHKRKVLIVLDDVDNQVQIETLARDPSWFGKGSRIIITSRIKDVLRNYYRVDEYSKFTMEMETLEPDQALQIFLTHAFGSNNTPTSTFQHLSKQVVSTAGGLPLTLTVLGSHLRNKDQGVWEEVIDRSKEVPPEEVIERLKISYEALESYVQQVFLDIACFFIGDEMTNASYMWRACDLSPVRSLVTLNSMSLVKTTKENTIWMHDQLRDLGRHIVWKESSHPTERSRLWIKKEATSVLMSKENKKNVRAIRLTEPCEPFNWNETHFSSLENLRYLQLKGSNFLMNFEGLLPNLIWLSWHSFPGEIGDMKLPLTNLVVLDLSESFIDENWGGWSQIQAAKELKVLDLTSCQNLTTTPEFSEHMPLERLILKACKKLVSLHSSITRLKKLKHLNLEECHLLRELPDVIHLIDDTLTEMLIVGSGLNPSIEPHQA